MFKGRRVGTLTAGVVLIIFGLLFIARIIFPHLYYAAILQLWPVILVFLGIEIVVSYVINKEEKLKYDGGAITLIIILSFFAIGMAGAEYLINHLEEFRKL